MFAYDLPSIPVSCLLCVSKDITVETPDVLSFFFLIPIKELLLSSPLLKKIMTFRTLTALKKIGVMPVLVN